MMFGGYRDFSGGSILHQSIDWRTSNSSQPSFTIKQSDFNVLFDSLLSDLAARKTCVQEIFARDGDIGATDMELIWSEHVCVENVHCDMREIGVGDPCSIMSCFDFTEFVRFDFVHCCSVGSGVVLDGDLSGHTTLRY